MLGGFITPADSSSTGLGIGLFITLKAERGMPGVVGCGYSRSSVARAPAAKAGGPGFDSQWLPRVFFSFSWLTNVDGMRICGALVHYRHRCEWGEGSVVL